MTGLVRTGFLLMVLLMIGGLVAACDSEQPVEPTGEPATTAAPPATEAPPATDAPPVEEDSTTPWWVLVIVLFGVLILIIALLAGSRRKKAVPPPAAWKSNAEHGYAEARWLSDNMTETLAIWHGDAKFEGDDADGATDATRARVWDQVTPRLERATSELYALEAAAGPNSPALRASQATISALNDTFAAFNARSDARTAYRTVSEADEAAPASELTAARDREARAATSLTEAQHRLTSALTELSAIA